MLSETANGPPVTSPRGEETSVNTSQVQCSVCSSTFRRPEHLKRHLRSHTKEKPFECNQCGRHFSRTDTLHRHELSHHAPGSEGGKDHTHRITVKTFRACFSCATARVRCSGGDPCGRCDTRSLGCQYPTERRSKARINHGVSRRLSGIDEPVQLETAESQKLSEIPINGLGDSHASPKRPFDTFSNITESHFGNTSANARRSGTGKTNARLYHPPLNAASASEHSLSGVPQNGDYREPDSDVTNLGVSVFSVSSTGPCTDMRSLPSAMASIGEDLDINMTGNASMALDFNSPLVDQSMLSTINWLPDKLLGAARSEVPPSENVSLQPSRPACVLPDVYAAHRAWQPPVINSDPSIYEHASQSLSGYHSIGNDSGGPRKFSPILNKSSPNPESVHSSKRSAGHHEDTDGAQPPKHRKQHARWPTPSAEPMALAERSFCDDSEPHFGFPPLNDMQVMVDNTSEVIRKIQPLQQSAYDKIHQNFLMLCCSKTPFFETFDSESFPSAETCTQYLACFFDSFQKMYPIFHLPTFDPNQCHWLVTTAVAAIGCHSSGIREVDRCTAAFHEMIRRAILAEKEKLGFNKLTLDHIQVMLLNCVGLLHSRSERARLSALGSFGDLVVLMNREKLLARPSPMGFSDGTSNEARWEKWMRNEIRLRTGYCVWLLDCTLAYCSDNRPLLSLDDGRAPLPAPEKLWYADSADAWIKLWCESNENDSLYDAVHILYIEKRLVPGIGEFSHILLIHALYHRMWEVGDYFRRPLSFWNPTAKKQPRDTAIPVGSVWLPGIPSYSKWRNSACDCLDILHWTANSTVAKAAGLEHPTILHLHVARLILLAPFREIRSLATLLATEILPWRKHNQAIEWQYIWRWIKHDQYKARLSIIHAGVALLHVRRYSVNAFHEPVAAFLAVLTLWAYGSCHSQALQESSPHTQGSRAESLHEASSIHLDQPWDDEIVQHFVFEGHSMRGTIAGVGDICAAEGPRRILRVGCEILSKLSAWGISKQLIDILSRLADVESQHSEHSKLEGESTTTA